MSVVVYSTTDLFQSLLCFRYQAVSFDENRIEDRCLRHPDFILSASLPYQLRSGEHLLIRKCHHQPSVGLSRQKAVSMLDYPIAAFLRLRESSQCLSKSRHNKHLFNRSVNGKTFSLLDPLPDCHCYLHNLSLFVNMWSYYRTNVLIALCA